MQLAAAASPDAGFLSQRAAHIRLTHGQLAELIGATRETSTKMLGDLRTAGLVTLHRGGIEVVNFEGLRELAEDGLSQHA